jgi:hypothetical protein
MFKIIITDIHLMSPNVLKETGAFLLRLAGCTDPVAHMVHTPMVGNTESAVNSVPSIFPIAPVDTGVTKEYVDGCDVSPGTKVLHVPSPDIIEEELIPVGPETAREIVQSQAIERDANGLPWDARIHTRTRSQTIDGVWKLQRGIDMTLVDTVMKEHKQLMALPQGKPATAPIAPPPAPIAPIAPASPSWPSSPTALAPSVPVTPVAADPVNDPCPADFNTFIARISKHIAKGLLGAHQVKAICEEHGVASLPLVASRPDLIPQIAAAIDLVAGG